MDILDLLKHECTDLPLNQRGDLSYEKFVEQILDTFLKALDEVEDYSFRICSEKTDVREYKICTKILCKGVNEAINSYYKGSPYNAYIKLRRALKKSKIVTFLNKNLFVKEGVNFYRIRSFNGSFALPKQGLFHIPFEERGKVKTQRFSIPGLPSLYISNSIYVAWEEMKRPDFNCIQAARLTTTRELKLLDLTTDDYNPNFNNEDKTGWDLLYKVLIWPLVACCSIKVKNQNDNFKPEYIIPQLLLQWINKED